MRGRKDNRIGAATRYKRKWFQVTRVSASLPAGMHGMKLRSRERRTFRLSAPQPALSSPAGSMPPGTPQPFFSLSPGTGCSKRPFTRPQRNPLSRIPFQGQRSRPAPSLPTPQFPSSFGFSLHYRSRFAPFRPLLCSSPLLVRCGARFACPRPPLPVRIFTSLRFKAFNRLIANQSAFRIRPIASRSPFPFLSLVSDPDHRSRLAPFRRLAVPQTSWNHLHYALE